MDDAVGPGHQRRLAGRVGQIMVIHSTPLGKSSCPVCPAQGADGVAFRQQSFR